MIEFTVEDIKQAVLSLNVSEPLDYVNLNVFRMLRVHPLVFNALQLLFNNIIRFGKVPLNFGRSVITPFMESVERSH